MYTTDEYNNGDLAIQTEGCPIVLAGEHGGEVDRQDIGKQGGNVFGERFGEHG